MRQDIGRMTFEGDTRGRKGGGEGYGESKTHDKREEEKGRRWEECGDGEREHVLWIPHLGVLRSVDTILATAGVWICLHVT